MTSTRCVICCVEACSKKRKKFHGASCKKAYNIIDNVLNEEFCLTIWSFVETSMNTAYLCFSVKKDPQYKHNEGRIIMYQVRTTAKIIKFSSKSNNGNRSKTIHISSCEYQ